MFAGERQYMNCAKCIFKCQGLMFSLTRNALRFDSVTIYNMCRERIINQKLGQILTHISRTLNVPL